MNRSRLSFLAGLTAALALGAVLAFVPPAWAQTGEGAQSGLAAFGEAAGFSAAPLPLVIARIIRTIISLLGILIVGYVLYGGFLYMTAGGDETRVKSAKRVLQNAIIGFVLVVSSFAIASFVISRISEATGSAGITGTGDTEIGCPGCVDGHVNSRRNFAMSGWNQQCGGLLRNAQLQWTFTQSVSSATVTNAQKPGIEVKDPAGATIAGTFAVRGNTVTFTPSAACPGPVPGAGAEKCFAADTAYAIAFNPTVLRSATGAQFQCGGLFGACSLSFTTGAAIDSQRPTVELTQPSAAGTSAAVGDIVPMQARIRDDVGGSLAQFFADDATKPVFSAGLANSNAGAVSPDNLFSADASAWNTAAFAPGSYDAWATGRDCAGHEAASAKVKVNIVGAQCVNGVKDGTETAVDCGGSCGACAGGACRVTAECATGFTCREGACVSTPRVDRVTAGDGAVGNLITIAGDGFGSDAGTIVFLGNPADAADDVSTPAFAGCTAAWGNRQAIVQVPVGAVSGPLELRAADFATNPTKADRTNDTFGPRLSDFTVNDVVRPGLCSVTPATGAGGIGVVLEGINFGPARQEGTVYFGDYTAAAYGTWTPATADVTVPRLDAGSYAVQMAVGGKVCQGTTTACTQENDPVCAGVPCISNRQGSNSVAFTVQSLTAQTPPRISGINPTQGPFNQYVTVSGVNFGSAGLVRFRDEATGKSAVGSVQFPEACGSAFWSDTSAVVKVPQTFSDGTAVVPGTLSLVVDRGGVVSEGVAFEIIGGTPGPGICSLDPVSGPTGTIVTVHGENFMGENRFVFRDAKPTAKAENNGVDQLMSTVPAGAVTGPMFVERFTPDQAVSNTVNFAVGSCRDGAIACTGGTQCCSNGTCAVSCGAVAVNAHYAYLFSTGPIPAAPRVVIACNVGSAASPSPWDGWSKPGTVCPNAVVTAQFDRPMDRAFMNVNSVRVQKCVGTGADHCASLEPALAGAFAGVAEQSFNWQKADRSPLDAGTLYQVTLAAAGFRSASRLSVEGVQLGQEPMERDYSWKFSTAASGAPCTIGGLAVQPDPFTATAPDQTVNYSASPIAKEDRCIVLACADDLRVSWNSDHTNEIGLADDTSTVAQCDQVATVRAAVPDNNGRAVITAQLANVSGEPKDDATLIVDFEDPKVLETWPACDTACLNSEIGARFNVAMAPGDLSVSTVELFACQNAVCNPTTRTKLAAAVTYSSVNASKVLLAPSAALQPNTYHQIRIAGSVRALRSGSRLADSYNGGDFLSAPFRTDRTGQACGIDRITVEPKEITARRVGEKATFTATPFGAPDACAPSGQRLSSASYEWNTWTSTDLQTPALPLSRVAFLLPPGAGEGAIQLYPARNLPLSCTSQCLNAGAQAIVGEAICGNSTVEATEDCDGGAMCSASCLRLPFAACATGATANCCGNGIVDGTEECDNLPAGGSSTCTAGCLNAGSTVYCGNGKIEGEAGEECDDDNRANGDGCSSVCLKEGSKTKASVLAVCGNGGSSEAGEDCDDGNVLDGDGCSARCLNEGTNRCVVATGASCCGNATVDVGEDCDVGSVKDGDGCSDRCLKEGSSVLYGVPSFCGNGGTPETGEECEVKFPTGAPKLQPFGVTQIDVTAPQEVNATTHLASASVTATETASKKFGQATVTLECACAVDSACGISGYGCGTANCCLERPVQTGSRPAAAATDVCRNADVWVEFSEPMDATSLAKNLFLELPGLTAVACTAAGGTMASPLAFVPPSSSLALRAWTFVRSLWQPETLQAAEGDAASTPRCLAFVTRTIVGNKIYVHTTGLMAPSATYRLVAIADDNIADANKVGVRSADQVTMDPAGRSAVGLAPNMVSLTSFTVGDASKICVVDRVQAEDEGKLNAAGTALVAPPEDKSIGFLTASSEKHRIAAAALSQDGQEIRPVAGTYEWTWTWNSNISDTDAGKNIVSSARTTDTTVPPTILTGTAMAGTANGSETVFATATVANSRVCEQGLASKIGSSCASDAACDTSPTTQDGKCGVGTTILGRIQFEALLCTHPSNIGRPYVQAQTNFGFTYCRDAGDQKKLDDDLPELTVAQAPSSPVGAFREFLFKLAGTPDGLGVRVIANDSYLAPAVWYANQGFKGSASPTKVDGYEAVQDGNTWYVFAPNVSGGKLYPNIYVISYNADARPGSQEAFKRILSTWRFNTNQNEVTNYNLCKASGDNTFVKLENSYVSCTWDGDCLGLDLCVRDKVSNSDKCTLSGVSCTKNKDCPYFAGGTLSCDAQKGKILRDTKRLQDVVAMKAAFDQLGRSARHCSVTKSQRCSSDAQCTNGETCKDDVPELASGTFLRTLAVSTWPSWSAALGNAVGVALPQDPINDFYGCQGAGYDPETCFNSAESKFVCPAKSQVYAFQSVGGESYTLSARLEYAEASWNKSIDLGRFDHATISVANAKDAGTAETVGFIAGEAFCGGTVLGASSLCGDGVKATDEACELGQVTVDTASCLPSGGYRNISCIKKTDGKCGWQTPAEAGACVPYRCGNGTKETGEDCDEGSRNGTYGSRCSALCKTYSVLNTAGFSFCGDGFLSGGEQCDCGMSENFLPLLNAYQSPLIDNWAKANQCGAANGNYSPTLSRSCSLDCRKPGPSCGDGIVQTGANETCEGVQEETATGFCGTTTQGCSTDAQCPAGITCIQFVNSKVCEKGLASKIGSVCTANADCDTSATAKDGKCSLATYPLITSRVCLAPGTANQCTFGAAAVGWSDKYAKGQPACGNGKKEGAELCDDGNLKDDDACTSECKLAVCGDGKTQQGVETCDYGAQNGVACTPSYGATCNYCTPQCQRKTVSGAYCGDGAINGNEFCDGNAVKATCVKTQDDGSLVTAGTCVDNAQCDTDLGYECKTAGVCNGGAFNGNFCTGNSGCIDRCVNTNVCKLSFINQTTGQITRTCSVTGTDCSRTGLCSNVSQCSLSGGSCSSNADCVPGLEVSCVMPQCASNCTSACPFNLETATLKMQPEGSNVTNATSVDLYAAGSGTPDGGFLTIPACTAATQFFADVSDAKVVYPNIDIVFVTDVSGSMEERPEGGFNYCVGGSDDGKTCDTASYTANQSACASPGDCTKVPYAQSRMAIAKESLQGAIDELFDSYVKPNAKLRIGLVTFPKKSENRPQDVENPPDEPLSASRQTLKNIVSNYHAVWNGTPTFSGVQAGLRALGTVTTGTQRILILMSDGAPTTPSGDTQVIQVYDEIRKPENAEIQFYSAAITSSPGLISWMEHMSDDDCGRNWSSTDPNECKPKDNVEYAYAANNAAGIRAMYGKIVNSILGVTVRYLTGANETLRGSAGSIRSGKGIPLPFPEGFVCRPTGGSQNVRFSVAFNAGGTVNFSNFKLTYCPVR